MRKNFTALAVCEGGSEKGKGGAEAMFVCAICCSVRYAQLHTADVKSQV